MTFSDEDLTAYLDGEADAALVAAVDTARASDTAVQDRLDKLRLLSDGLPGAFDGLLTSAPAYPLPIAPQSPRWHLPAGLAAALVVGIGLGTLLRGGASDALDGPEGWMEYVAAYQALYVPQTLAGVALDKVAQGEQLAALGAALGRDLTLPKVDGLTYRRGQVLGFEDQTLIQLAFLSEAGDPLALCIIQRPGAPDSQPETARMEGMEAAHWVSDGYGFLLIGGQDDALVSVAAEHFNAAL